MTEISTAVDVPSLLGECPVWSTVEQVLYWVDIEGRLIHRYDPSTGTDAARPTPARPGSFVLTAEPGKLIVATEHELAHFDWDTGTLTPWVAIESAALGNRLNDGRCDGANRFVVGTMWPDTQDGRSEGSLYSIEVNGSHRKLQTDIGVPNGLVFDPERKRMYFADTFTRTIWMWDYDADSGERHNGRLFFEYTDEVPGLPDGACLDADGCYWSASVYGWALTRITPDGAVDRRVELPVEKPSMPAFGGADLSTLFVTTIGDGGNVPSKPAKEGFTSGSLLAVDVGVQGIPEPVFGPA